jgi:hypothetical protein
MTCQGCHVAGRTGVAHGHTSRQSAVWLLQEQPHPMADCTLRRHVAEFRLQYSAGCNQAGSWQTCGRRASITDLKLPFVETRQGTSLLIGLEIPNSSVVEARSVYRFMLHPTYCYAQRPRFWRGPSKGAQAASATGNRGRQPGPRYRRCMTHSRRAKVTSCTGATCAGTRARRCSPRTIRASYLWDWRTNLLYKYHKCQRTGSFQRQGYGAITDMT